jgi:hypothetical protein
VRHVLPRPGQTAHLRARWTEQILDEMVVSILRRRPDLDAARLARTRELMCDAIPDCLVTGHEALVDALSLPDVDDRHVLAAAIRCGAEVIVTENLADFPADVLAQFHIEAQSPDQFVLHLIELAPGRLASVLQQQVSALTKPEQSVDDLMERLTARGLPRAMAVLRGHLGT